MHDQPIRQYDAFSADYHWLYSDQSLSEPLSLEEQRDDLSAAGPHARILDCSCGVGIFLLALAKRGYPVSGSDGSPGMIEQASLAANRASLEIPLRC